MSSGYGSLTRPRYSRGRRAAAVAACASVLTGTSLALPAASFADDLGERSPIASPGVAGTPVQDPAVSAPAPAAETPAAETPAVETPAAETPAVETSTDAVPAVWGGKGAIELLGAIDPAPQPPDAQSNTTPPTTPQPTTTQPSTSEPGATGPSTSEPSASQPAAPQPTTTQPSTSEPSASQPAAPQPSTSEPSASQPAASQPAAAQPDATQPDATQPDATQPAATQPDATQPDATQPGSTPPATEAPATTGPDTPAPPAGDVLAAPSSAWGPNSGHMTLTSMLVGAAVPGGRLATSLPTGGGAVGQANDQAAGEAVDKATVTGVLKVLADKQTEAHAAVQAAQVLGTEKAAPTSRPKHGGLGLAAPLTDLSSDQGQGDVDSMKVDSLNLAAGNGPASASGDWNLMPEVLYAIVPLLMAGAAVVTHSRRNAAMAPSVGVIQRRRHASE